MERILGQDTLEFYGQAEEVKSRILACRNKLLAGKPRVNQQVPFTTGSGKNIILGLHGSLGIWNGRPAMLAMSEDITEKKNNEERIAAYVSQLEGAMEGTLQAVAKMVDLRDPYTAGHERRVALVSAGIAHEMGWSEERAGNKSLAALKCHSQYGYMAMLPAQGKSLWIYSA